MPPIKEASSKVFMNNISSKFNVIYHSNVVKTSVNYHFLAYQKQNKKETTSMVSYAHKCKILKYILAN